MRANFSFDRIKRPKLATSLVILLLVTSAFTLLAIADQKDEKISRSTAAMESMNWNIETVDDRGNVGSSTSLAVDSNGNPYISYYDDNNSETKYAVWQGDSWHTETVQSSNGGSSIAVDSDDIPYLCFSSEVDSMSPELKGAKREQDSWNVRTVDNGTDFSEVGNSISMKTEKDSYMHFAYTEYFPMEAKFTLKYGYWDGDSLNIEVVDGREDVYPQQISLAVDSKNNPHISYYDRDPSTGEAYGLRYAKYTGSSWETETVDSDGDVGSYCSIDIDSEDNPHLVYYDNTNFNIKYAEWTGSSWSFEQIYDDQAGDFSLELDSDDDPHISFSDLDSRNLRYATRSDSSWNLEVVDSDGSVGGSSSLALDSEENVHIGYYDFENDALKYAKGSEGTGVSVPGAPGNVQAYGQDTEVKLTWDAPSDDGGSSITGYNIYRGTSSGDLSSYETVGESTTTYTDTEVTNEQTYYYQVSAVNTAGEGDRSGEVSATPTSDADTTPPTADAGEDKTVNVGEEITLDASGSSDNNGIDNYNWDLDNGDTRTGEQVTYTYDETGTYDVELTVTDEAGNTDTDTITITVEEVDSTDDGDTDDGDDDGGTPGFTMPLIICSSIIALAIYSMKKE